MHFHFASGKNQTYINNNNNRTTINKKQPNKKTSTEKNMREIQKDAKMTKRQELIHTQTSSWITTTVACCVRQLPI